MATSTRLDEEGVLGRSAAAGWGWTTESSLRVAFSLALSLMLAVAMQISGFLARQMQILFGRYQEMWPEWSALLLPWVVRHEGILTLAAALSVWLPWLTTRLRSVPVGLFLLMQLLVGLAWMTGFLLVLFASGVVAGY